MSRIFISHSHSDNAAAVAVRDWMAAQGWDDVFLDLDPERGLRAGERWQEALKRAAQRCELVVFLVSPEWAQSKWCLAEFLLAKSLNKRIFAAIVAPTPLADLPVEMTAEWQVLDLTAGSLDHRATVALPGGLTTEVSLAKEGLTRLRIGLMQAGLDAKFFAWPPANDPNRPPYRGLKPLEAEDAGIFFGRDGPIVEAIDRMRGLREAAPPRLLVILGASGSGKSSFLRAGLLPRLARDDRHFFTLPPLRPEHAAITGEAGLVACLATAFDARGTGRTRSELRSAVAGGVETLRPLLLDLVASATPLSIFSPANGELGRLASPTLILPVDQGEELFLAEGDDESGQLLALLRDLLVTDAPALTVLFTIRSDNYERLQSAKALEGVRQTTLSLPPMPQGAYTDVIRGPARRLAGSPRNLDIEDRLVERLLGDIEKGGSKDALPLLAFTMERLYVEHGGDGDLRLDEYESLGGITGSIEAAVERAFKAADGDGRIPRDRQARLTLLRRGLIPWLAGIDPDTGAPRRRVARLSEIPAEARPLVDLLVDQRLLSTDVAKDTSEKTVEPAHEALLRQWELLQGWLAEDAGLLSVMDGVKRASRDWAANGKSAAWVTHTTDRLRAAERLLERRDLAANLEPTDRDYLTACLEEELLTLKRSRRSRTRGVALAMTITTIIAFGLVGAWMLYSAGADKRKLIFAALTDGDSTIATKVSSLKILWFDKDKSTAKGEEFVSYLPVIDVDTNSHLPNEAMSDAIAAALEDGTSTIYWGAATSKLGCNVTGERGARSAESLESARKLDKTYWDPNLSATEKVNIIIESLLIPNRLDCLVSGHYQRRYDGTAILRPYVVSRPARSMGSSSISLTRDEVGCLVSITRGGTNSCPEAHDRIRNSMVQLLTTLSPR